MKKILKKLSCALLAAAMVCAMTPLAASAAINYSKTRIVYMPTSGKDLGYDEISISNIPAKQNILKSNVKVVSGGSVIALDSFGSSSCKSTTEAFRKGAKPYTHSDNFYKSPEQERFPSRSETKPILPPSRCFVMSTR